MKAMVACSSAPYSSGLEKRERTMQAQASALILSNAGSHLQVCLTVQQLALLSDLFFIYYMPLEPAMHSNAVWNEVCGFGICGRAGMYFNQVQFEYDLMVFPGYNI